VLQRLWADFQDTLYSKITKHMGRTITDGHKFDISSPFGQDIFVQCLAGCVKENQLKFKKKKPWRVLDVTGLSDDKGKELLGKLCGREELPVVEKKGMSIQFRKVTELAYNPENKTVRVRGRLTLGAS
jgi:hypothetical protein